MASKSKARQAEIVRLSKTELNPLELAKKVFEKVGAWSGEQNSPLTTEDVIRTAAYLLNLKRLIRVDPIQCSSRILKKTRSQERNDDSAVYRPLVIRLVSEARYTRRQIIDKVIVEYPDVKKATIGTFLSDSTTWRFSKIAEQYGLIQKDGRDILFFDGNTIRPTTSPAYRKTRRSA